jgi:hypothetical protein
MPYVVNIFPPFSLPQSFLPISAERPCPIFIDMETPIAKASRAFEASDCDMTTGVIRLVETPIAVEEN